MHVFKTTLKQDTDIFLKYAPPLGELASLRLVLGAPLVQVVQPLGGGLLALGAEQLLDALVNLDAGDDPQLVDEIDEPPPSGRGSRGKG